MTTLVRASFLRFGLHAAGDYQTAPTPTKFLRAANMPVLTGLAPAYVERDGFQTGDGSRLPGFQAGQELGISDISAEMRGLSGGGADDGTNTSTLGLELDEFLEALAGTAGANAVGEESAASPGSGTTLVAGSSVTTSGIVPRLILGDDGKYHARMQLSASAANITLDRALVGDAGGSVDFVGEEDIYAGRLFTFSTNAPDSRHIYLDAEDGDERMHIYGCYMSGGLVLTPGGGVMLNLSNIMATSWEGAAKDNPSYAAATRGLPVRVLASPLFIGANMYQAAIESIDFGINHSPRESNHAPNMAWGHVRTECNPVMTGTIRAGSSTTPREVTAALLDSLRGDDEAGTQDVAVQIGREPGRCLYARMPEADVRLGAPTDSNGQKVYPFEARGTGATPLQLGVF